ncbi:GAF and HD-GYP domain-containing protein [Pseudidiomarina mangrovi]|uniref:GAF and HD-GYP domain-containing protein n=1 Tax=Pseudidiomarina mangrovi TaxID=2487133 RepID=UPI000FCC6830|nr:HD family phosphohydrolase [Pseudidiomarina mangrovi]CAI8163555.1 MAG: 3'3'-cGAMP-specific phosphodiesterase 1 [Pseudidiomarina mangrovi]
MATYDLLQRIRELNRIGIALSAERDAIKLLELILTSARRLSGADAGSLYLVKQRQLEFALVQNQQLGIHYGGYGEPLSDKFKPLPMYNADGMPNDNMVAVNCVISERTIAIADAYATVGYDFSGTHAFDQNTGYRTRSVLAVPLKNHENEVIGALQLINKLDTNGHTVPFVAEDIELTESLASQAAIALTNQRLVADLHHLFDSFTEVIANAIDAKSPQTGAHCRRVPELTLMIADAANGARYPGLEQFRMSADERYELKTAAWMHDCGKIVTPPHVVEKSRKLETISDRMDTVEARFAALAKQPEWARQKQQLLDDLAFLHEVNKGGETLSDEAVARIEEIAQYPYCDVHGEYQPLLNEQEVAMLSIRRGTLTADERQIMQDHMVHTINMLEQLPFPKHLARVPEYAAGHHEHMDGKGYPRGLTREQMSIPARMMGIADVFEALTAPDRTYKKAMSISQSLNIMGEMVESNHLDPDLFKLFVDKQVYLAYAKKFLKAEQIDEPDLLSLPGYSFQSDSKKP